MQRFHIVLVYMQSFSSLISKWPHIKLKWPFWAHPFLICLPHDETTLGNSKFSLFFQNARASYDFSSNDPYPYPRYTDDWFNSHGTRCAGEVSGARDNGVCGSGVAYDSMVAGIRMLDQPYMTDLIEANSMGHEPNLIDIYSASWGPTDDGRTVDGPRNATMRAIVRGVNEVSSF